MGCALGLARIYVPQPGIECGLPTVKAQNIFFLIFKNLLFSKILIGG